MTAVLPFDHGQRATARPPGLHERLQAAGPTHLVFTGVTTEAVAQGGGLAPTRLRDFLRQGDF